MSKGKTVEALTAELFRAIERAQGYAFHSDGAMFRTPEEFFARVRGRRDWAIEVVQIYGRFLAKYGEQDDPEPAPKRRKK